MEVHICFAGPTYRIDAFGKSWWIEITPGCGLAVCNKHGDPIKEPGPRSPLWKAVETWQRQGSRVVDGVCVVDPEPPRRTIKLWRGNYHDADPADPRTDDEIRDAFLRGRP
jgi:hypothetical protein